MRIEIDLHPEYAVVQVRGDGGAHACVTISMAGDPPTPSTGYAVASRGDKDAEDVERLALKLLDTIVEHATGD